MRWLLVGLIATGFAVGAGAEPPQIRGETRYPPHGLVRLRAEGVGPKSAVLWRVYPANVVQRATTPRGLLEFAAPPGTYEVELLVITATDDGLTVEEARLTVVIEPPGKPGPRPEMRPEPVKAVGRVRFGNAGCSATVIGPQRADGRWDVLTAAHCVSGTGQRGSLTLRDGRTVGLRVVSVHATPDLAWCVTDDPIPDLPYAVVARSDPEPGTPVWHAGFGTDRPGNREEGIVAERPNAQGQVRMLLSVSSGDVGGRHLPRRQRRAGLRRVLHGRAGTQGVGMGASVEVIRRTRPLAEGGAQWVPLPIPLRQEPWPRPEDGEAHDRRTIRPTAKAPQPIKTPSTDAGSGIGLGSGPNGTTSMGGGSTGGSSGGPSGGSTGGLVGGRGGTFQSEFFFGRTNFLSRGGLPGQSYQ